MATAAARRYAKAIFELAQESGQAKRWSERLEVVAQFLRDPELAEVLGNPSVTVARRQELAQALGGSNLIDQEALNLIKLLVESNRTGEIDGVVEEYERLRDELEGRLRATAVTAVELSDKEVRQLVAQLSKQVGKEVRLETEVDPAILGGLVLRVGDRLVDASVRTRLQQLRRRLATV